MREIDDAADAEDQRQAERDQEVIASEHQAIHHLFQQEIRTACAIRELKERRRRLLCAGAATPVCPTLDPGFYAFMLQGFCVFVG